MGTSGDTEHFVFPLGHSLILINDFVVRRDLLELLPIPLALKVDDRWVWMNRSAEEWMALAGQTEWVAGPVQTASGPKPDARFRVEPLINLDGDQVGTLAFGGDALTAVVVDHLQVGVVLARAEEILWANAAFLSQHPYAEHASWDGLEGFPDWQDVVAQSRTWRVGTHRLRCQVLGEFVLGEYFVEDSDGPGSDITLSLEQVASMVHEIRNPLAALSGYVEMAQMEAAGPTAAYYENMMREIDRISRLTSDLLSISRFPVVNPEWIPLDPLVDNAWMVATQTRSKADQAPLIRLTKHYGAEQQVWADADRLQQVLTNLIKNAVEALGESGGTIDVSCREEDGKTILTVRDDGPGIPVKAEPHLTRRRFSTKDKGNGLGLMIVRRIVQAHGGSFTITSHDGTVATFTLPGPD